MYKTIFLFLISCFLHISASAGITADSVKQKKNSECMFMLKLAYHQQQTAYAEAGLFCGFESHLSSWGSGIIYGPAASAEFLLQTQQGHYSVVAPKIGFDFYNGDIVAVPWGARCNIAYYTTDGAHTKQNSVKLCPEAGLSLWSFINIFYGYNIPLSNKSFVDNNGHRFTVMINIPYKTIKYNKQPDTK